MREIGEYVAKKAKGRYTKYRDGKGKLLLEKIKQSEIPLFEARQQKIEQEREQARKILALNMRPLEPNKEELNIEAFFKQRGNKRKSKRAKR